MFAFSRLDVELALCLVWADGGQQIEMLTPTVTTLTFHRKLDRLEQLAKVKFAEGSKKRVAWAQWIEHAYAMRARRNQLTHGRWGVDPCTDEAINVIGLPTSPD